MDRTSAGCVCYSTPDHLLSPRTPDRALGSCPSEAPKRAACRGVRCCSTNRRKDDLQDRGTRRKPALSSPRAEAAGEQAPGTCRTPCRRHLVPARTRPDSRGSEDRLLIDTGPEAERLCRSVHRRAGDHDGSCGPLRCRGRCTARQRSTGCCAAQDDARLVQREPRGGRSGECSSGRAPATVTLVSRRPAHGRSLPGRQPHGDPGRTSEPLRYRCPGHTMGHHGFLARQPGVLAPGQRAVPRTDLGAPPASLCPMQ